MSLANKLSEERRGRLAAERLLELKQAELLTAHQKLGRHAQALSMEITETRAEVATVRDENQRVKSDLNVAHQKVEVAERRLWHSIQTVTDGFAFFDDTNRMLAANKAYLAVFDGLEAIGPGVNYVTILQALTDEGIVNTEDLDPDDWRAMMTARWMSQDPPAIVVRLWNDQFIKLIDRRGPGGDIVSLGLNITTTVEYEAKLKEARAIAESANRAKSTFLANMSHEIRTPMNGVVGMAELLSGSQVTDEQRLYIDTIKNSGEALLTIINDVLDYSKIEADKLALHPEPFDLEQCIHEIMILLQHSAREKAIDLLIDYDPLLPTVFIGDPGRLRQVLTNLVGNATKFTARGHVIIRVTGARTANMDKTQITVVVEDTGIGIPAEKTAHIFGEFNQVQNERNRQFDGTGLGLAISQRLIALMDGDIWVESVENAGSKFGFSVDLPPAGLAQNMPPGPVIKPAQILILEGHTQKRGILQRQLSRMGHDAIAPESAKGIWPALSPHTDLVFIGTAFPDVALPQMIDDLRATAPDLRIVRITQGPGVEPVEAITHRVDTVLQEPLTARDLLRMIAQLTPDQSLQISKHPHLDEAFDTRLSSRALRVLAAEDNKTNQLVLNKMLNHLDLDLRFASNGEEAVALFQDFQPDLVFMDISMPKMDGKDATRAIRALEGPLGTRTPIIALTAHAMDGDDAAILEAGLDHYLSKPLRRDALITHIEAVRPQGVRPVTMVQAG